MREKSLDLIPWNDSNMRIIDVGSGTGFTTQGIVKRVPAEQVTCIDQSDHQMARAQQKGDLQACHFKIGDAENIPFPTDHFDRYVSAGSIEYWPDPQRGITEAYRVIRPGGQALMIGPLEPGSWFSRFIATVWMLFPKEQEYRQWYEDAGFTDIKMCYVSPHWHRSNNNHYGIAIVGTKPQTGLSPIDPRPKADPQAESLSLGRQLLLVGRILLGSIAGFFFIPIALLGYLWSSLNGRSEQELTQQQRTALLLISGLIVVLIIWALS